MNTVPVIQTSAPPTIGPSAAPAAGTPANAGGAQSAFAGALNAAGAKPSRRPGSSKQSDDGASGGSLPPAGNQSPLPPPPPAAATAVATPHTGGSAAADSPRPERGRANGPASAENPLAIQAAAGAAALIDGAKSPAGAVSATHAAAVAATPGAVAATRAAAVAATPGAVTATRAADAATPAAVVAESAGAAIAARHAAAVTNDATHGTVAVAAGGQSALQAGVARGPGAPAAKFATTVEASTAIAADGAASATATATATAAVAAKPKAPPPIASLPSNRGLTPDSATLPAAATAVDPSVVPASAPATSAAATPSAGTTQVAASAGWAPAATTAAAADQAAVKPQPVSPRPVAKAMGRTAAPATDSVKAPADDGEADSTLSPPSASASDSTAVSGATVPTPAVMGTGAQDAAVTATAAAAAAAVAGTPQPANTGKAGGDNSYDSDASVGATGAGAAAAASTLPGQSGMRAVADPLPAVNTADAPLDTDKHAPAGFDLAALTGGSGDAAAGLSQLTANAAVSAPADATPTPALKIHASVDSAEFSPGLSDRVSWMVDNGLNGAKLQVNPPQLGPIELRISVQGDRAQVWMTTHSAVTRDALDASSPKLREMLNNQGFSQVSVDISQRSFQDRSAYVPPYQREQAAVRSTAATAAPTAAAATPRSQLGALDAYA